MDYLYDSGISDEGNHFAPNKELRKHLAALRIREGQTFTLFNGKGLRASCTLQGSAADGILNVVSRMHVEAPLPLTLAMGLLDSRDRLEFAIEKATELGVTSIVLLESEHASRLRATLPRLHAKIIAACEQCGQLWLPSLAGPMSIDDFLKSTSASVLLLGDQHGESPQPLNRGNVGVVVGPEGGFSQREQMLLHADPRTHRWVIGSQRLRSETAAIAMVSVAQSMFRERS